MDLGRAYDNRLRITNNIVYSSSTPLPSAKVTLACITSGCPSFGGSVSVTVGGVPTTFVTGSTLSALASNLVSAINSTDGMTATATSAQSGTKYVVTLTSLIYGADGEASLSASVSNGATFTATTSSAKLTGDKDTIAYQYSLAYAPNNNVTTASDSINGNWTYLYDTLNRLVRAQATTAGVVTPSGTFKTQCWTYDSFGNRTGEGEVVAKTTCPSPLSKAPRSSWSTYAASNRVTQTTAPGATVNYVNDGAGNVLNDGVNQYVYDIDGRICAVRNVAAGSVMTQYVYDAEGRRVAKGTISTWPAAGQTCAAPTSANGFSLAGTGAARYLRGLHGDQDTELDGTGNWRHTNVFAAGGLTTTYDAGATPSTAPTFNFNFADWLGTKRLQASNAAVTLNSWASDPFGSYLLPQGTGADATEHHFTGKERDTESGNDYFGARYYASGLGRWLSPDLSATSGLIVSPQRLNRYVYVVNNPLSLFDADGMKDKPFNAKTDKPIDTQRANTTATPIVLGNDKNGNPIYNKDAYNCHSYAWDEGQGDPKDKKNRDLAKVGVSKWDNDPQSKLNGWKQLSPDEPNKPGDRVIYYIDKKNKGEYVKGDPIEHSAIVRTVDSEGNTTEVEGKMGQWGLSENHPNAPGYYDKVKDESDPDNGKTTSRAYFRKEEKSDTSQPNGSSTQQQQPQQPQQ
jgi:RHS repeat-associated protein